jgi:lipopolysaccharide/colanic/teichoic acid biosynthesis glycosyltransferase
VQDGYRLVVKRCIDIVGAIVGLIILGPLMLATAAAIKLTSPGPALFAQEHCGLRKRCFRMYKFRTMVPDAEKLQETLESQNEAQGPVFKIRNDPRITPIGRILRKTSLDELPQFFNVLRGELSLVGPRPLPKRDVSRVAATNRNDDTAANASTSAPLKSRTRGPQPRSPAAGIHCG